MKDFLPTLLKPSVFVNVKINGPTELDDIMDSRSRLEPSIDQT